MKEENSSMRGENMMGLLFWKKKCFEFGFYGGQRGLLLERTGKVISCRWNLPLEFDDT